MLYWRRIPGGTGTCRAARGYAERPGLRRLGDPQPGLRLALCDCGRIAFSGRPLFAIVGTAAWLRPDGETRIKLHGPAVELPPTVARSVRLSCHELATNAAKY